MKTKVISRSCAVLASIALGWLMSGPVFAVTYEAESLPVTNSGTGTSLQTDANASGGRWVSLDAEGSGSWMEFTTPTVAAGTFTVRMRYKSHPSRGQLTLRVDGTQLGGTLDQYAATAAYPEATFGTVTFASSASHKIRLAVVGRNASATGYVLSADRFSFTASGATPTPTPSPVPTPTPIPGGVNGGTWEAQALSYTASGASTAMQTDSSATGGTWLALQADGSGDYVQFTTPILNAGSYSVTLRYKAHTSRGILQASVDGANLGGTLDQYSSSPGFTTRTFGTVTLSAGTHTLRLTCTGRNSSSGAYTLSADTITFALSGSNPTPTPTPTPSTPTPTPTPTPAPTPTPTPTPGGSPVTEGWTQMSWTYSMHKPYDVSLSERFSYSNGVWTCWLFPDDQAFQPPPKVGGPRTELRWNNDYTSGQRMWDADIWVLSPTRSTVMQLFGGSESSTGYQIRSFEDGTLRRYTSGNLVTNAFERWINIKVAHNVSTHTVRSYVNDLLVRTDPDRGAPTNVGAYYFKNGLYGCETGRCEDRFRNLKQWRR